MVSRGILFLLDIGAGMSYGDGTVILEQGIVDGYVDLAGGEGRGRSGTGLSEHTSGDGYSGAAAVGGEARRALTRLEAERAGPDGRRPPELDAEALRAGGRGPAEGTDAEPRSEGCAAAFAKGTRGFGQCPPSARVAFPGREGQGLPGVSTEGQGPPGASTQPPCCHSEPSWRAAGTTPAATRPKLQCSHRCIK